jgi:uncharacterized membrane protein (UPF0136 family)
MIVTIVWLYLYIFGVLTIAGGVVGYVRAKSTASLVAGTIAGALLLVSGYLVGTGARGGMFLGLAVSSSMAVRFVGAFVRSKKIMPAGVMSLLSIAGTVLSVLALTSLR